MPMPPLKLCAALAAVLALSACKRSEPDTFFRVSDAEREAATREAPAIGMPHMVRPVIVDAPDEASAAATLGDAGDDAPDDGPDAAPAPRPRVDASTGPTRPASTGDAASRRAESAARDAAAPRIAAGAAPRPSTPTPSADVPAAGGTDARDLNRRGIALINGGRPEDALPLLERAAELAPRDAEVLGNLGYAHLLTGAHAKARTRFMQALELSPNRSATWLNLGQTYAELGERDVAVDAVVTGYRYSTQKPAVRSALQRAAQGDRHSARWREAAGLALDRIASGA